MDRKKKKKKSSSADVRSNFKESVLVSKKNFHRLLSSSTAAAPPPPPQSRKAVMRSRMGKKRIIDFDDVEVPETELSSSPEGLRLKRDRKESLLEMLPRDTSRSLHRFVAWLSSTSKRIKWDPISMEVSLEGERKPGSSIVDMLTFLAYPPRDNTMYPSSHKFGIFKGIPLGTTHFQCVLGEEMYSLGMLNTDPHGGDQQQHFEDLTEILQSMYNLNRGTIHATLALSQPERLAIQESLQKEREKKEEQKMEKERIEREHASLQETLDRVNEAEEAERL